MVLTKVTKLQLPYVRCVVSVYKFPNHCQIHLLKPAGIAATRVPEMQPLKVLLEVVEL